MHIIHKKIGLPRIRIEKIAEHRSLFIVEPLPTYYGMTLGNAFRRILLSSLPGTAVTAVKFDKTTHEFTTLSGVKDSVLEILLNFKRLVLKKKSKDPTILKLDVKNRAGKVTAKDIQPNTDVEILNPDFEITTLEKSANLKMEIVVEKGVGYLPAAERQVKNREAGLIYLDAMFSPVKLVRYDREAARVHEMTDLDRLSMEVETTGAMTPTDAVKFASNLLQSYAALFNEPEQEKIEPDFVADKTKILNEAVDLPLGKSLDDDEVVEKDQTDQPVEEYTPIETLKFPARITNAFLNNNIGSVQNLLKCTYEDLKNFRGCGKKVIEEVEKKLKESGLNLAMDRKHIVQQDSKKIKLAEEQDKNLPK